VAFKVGTLVNGTSSGPDSTISEVRRRREVRALRKTGTIWLFALAAAAIVVIEGFALSWGGNGSPPSRASVPSTVPAAASPNICAKGATFRFIRIDYLRYGGGSQPATVSGHVVTLHCGGPDDFQFLVQTTPETVRLRTNARITLMTLAPAFYSGTLSELNNYLARDEDGNIFLVTGPNSGAAALRAMFHP
jgi:hypothetical protein